MCVGRVVVSVGGVCWEGGSEVRVCVGRIVESEGVCVWRVVYRKERGAWC